MELALIQITRAELNAMIVSAIAEALTNFSVKGSKEDEQFLTRSQVAKMFQVSLTTINSWSRDGIIKRYYLRSRVFYKKSEIVDLFQTQ
jgi:hypothetical protein